ncbi:unnamed protein product [Ilex paraguariensis]|uniref:S-adenosyl-L-methionine-dependent methyltransferase n=1 Tax=Ilex paraguariensis TaxID=185542 RepID=A0ABC8U1K5_9AQUA
MECLAGFVILPTAASPIMRSSLFCAPKKYRNAVVVSAKLQHNDDDPLFRAAVSRASLRFQETHRPEPLFVDPYAGCFVPLSVEADMKHQLHQYCLATKFIDDKLLTTTNNIDGLKQVVLLTDGMDTRPYRLNWPTSTIIFDISPERVFKKAAQKLEGCWATEKIGAGKIGLFFHSSWLMGVQRRALALLSLHLDNVGAKIPRSCLFFHVPSESPYIQQTLCSKGFTGNRPSIWAFQVLRAFIMFIIHIYGFK